MVAGSEADDAGFLLDTNVISEMMKPRPEMRVAEWIDRAEEGRLYLSAITIGEVRKGIELLAGDDARRARLDRWLREDVRVRFAGRILPFDDAVAERWGELEASARKQGAILSTLDAQLAATAVHHGLTFVTRNTAHVRATGVAILDPWAT